MTRKHFEYMAAEIAHTTQADSDAREVIMDFAVSLAAKFNNFFDVMKFLDRIEQYDNGERSAITYLNNH